MTWQDACRGALTLGDLHLHQRSLMGKEVRVRGFLIVDYGRTKPGREHVDSVDDIVFDAGLFGDAEDDEEMFRQMCEGKGIPFLVVNIEGLEEVGILDPIATATNLDHYPGGQVLYGHSAVVTGILMPSTIPDAELGLLPIEITVLRVGRADGQESATIRVR